MLILKESPFINQLYSQRSISINIFQGKKARLYLVLSGEFLTEIRLDGVSMFFSMTSESSWLLSYRSQANAFLFYVKTIKVTLQAHSAVST